MVLGHINLPQSFSHMLASLLSRKNYVLWTSTFGVQTESRITERVSLHSRFWVLLFICFAVVLVWFWFFHTGFLCVTILAALRVALQTRLALNSQRPACPCLLGARIKDVRHHRPATYVVVFNQYVTTHIQGRVGIYHVCIVCHLSIYPIFVLETVNPPMQLLRNMHWATADHCYPAVLKTIRGDFSCATVPLTSCNVQGQSCCLGDWGKRVAWV